MTCVKEDVDPCLAFLDLIEPRSEQHDEVPLRKIDKQVLNMYVPYPNLWFLNEGITVDTQRLFEVGYSINDNCITVPIRDELGSLVGVKGRTTLDYKKLSETQVIKLERLGVEVILAFDNNITKEEIKEEAAKFVIRENVRCLYIPRFPLSSCRRILNS